jgi:hypothetical protein
MCTGVAVNAISADHVDLVVSGLGVFGHDDLGGGGCPQALLLCGDAHPVPSEQDVVSQHSSGAIPVLPSIRPDCHRVSESLSSAWWRSVSSSCAIACTEAFFG